MVLLEKRRHSLDLPYIEKWVQELGLTAQWLQARRLADMNKNNDGSNEFLTIICNFPAWKRT